MKRNLPFIAILFWTLNLSAQQLTVNDLRPIVDFENGSFQQAIDSINQLADIENNSYYLTTRINAYVNLNQFDKALIDCDLLEKIQKGNGSKIKAEIYFQLNDLRNAEKTIIKNLASSNKISLYKLLTDKKYEKIQNTDFIDSILKTNTYSATEKQIFKVQKYIAAEELDEALFLVNQIINRNQHVSEAYFLQSKILEANSEYKNAIAGIDKAIFLDPLNIDYYLQRISINNRLGSFSEMVNDLNKAIRINPYKADLYLLKAEALLNTSEYEKAVQIADFYLGLFPQNAEAFYVKAKVFFNMNNNIEALKNINESLLNKKSVRQFELRGDIYMKTTTYNFAEKDYSMALDLDARNGELWTKKGFARYQSGNKTGACADWEKGKRYGSIAAIEYLGKLCK